MNTTTSTYDPNGSSLDHRAAEAADKVGEVADDAVHGARRMANDALDKASDTIDNVRDQAEPTVRRLAAQAETLARKGMDAVRDSSQQLREQATEMTDRTTRRTRLVRQSEISFATSTAYASPCSASNSGCLAARWING